MAHLMVVQCSGRRKGYTATLMETAVAHLQKAYPNIDVEVFHLHDYTIGPCTSCFSCIRNIGSGCVLDDDWGRRGKGILYKAFKHTNGLFIIDPVYEWGISAGAHLFMERIYPVIWEGVHYGMPMASVSCASNQGFMYRATEEFCKLAAADGFRYIGGLPVHALYFKQALVDVTVLADKIAEATIEDEKSGRTKMSDEETFLMYKDAIWNIVHGYLQNLTADTFDYTESLPYKAIEEGLVTDDEALPFMEKVCAHLEPALNYYHNNDLENAAKECAQAAKYWTHATFYQCCQGHLSGAGIPESYRPLDTN
jgi:multimeric flavodoxin WrbA